MAKRKNRSKSGFVFTPAKDYRSEAYVPYLVSIETGILQAGTVFPELTDGDVDTALDDLISELKESTALPKLLPSAAEDNGIQAEEASDPVTQFILLNLRDAFETNGPLSAEDVSGLLKVVKSSVKTWNVGMHRRGYLEYIEGFLAQAGINVQKISAEEARQLGLEVDDDDE